MTDKSVVQCFVEEIRHFDFALWLAATVPVAFLDPAVFADVGPYFACVNLVFWLFFCVGLRSSYVV